jgi:hypothetical protein
MLNSAADRWAVAATAAKEIYARLEAGETISYDEVDEIGESTWAEVKVLAARDDKQIADEGDGKFLAPLTDD